MSAFLYFDVYGHRALGAQDVRDAFESFGCWVRPLLDGTFQVGVGDFSFYIVDCPSPASRPGLVEWLARVRGVPAYTHLYGAEIEDVHRYVDDFDEADALWDDIRGAFALLAERIGGVLVLLDYDPAQPTDYYDEETGQTYRFPDEVDSAAEPEGPSGPALDLDWYGLLSVTPHPAGRWIEACERYFPDLVPDYYDYERRPITAAARRYLLDPDSRQENPALIQSGFLGRMGARLPRLSSGGSGTANANPNPVYGYGCRVLLRTVEERMSLREFRRFFTTMARELRSELATGQVLRGYASDGGEAVWVPGAEQPRSLELSRDYEFLGLPSAPSWWVWLGPDWARVVSGWLERGAPSSWVVEETGDGGVFVQTSADPVVCESGAGAWFPEEFLPTVGPVPRRRLVDWLLGVRPRAQVGPARVMPTWTRPTTDTNAEGTNGPDADAGTAHNPITGPGADGTTGPDADAGTAHNPTTGPGAGGTAGPDTRPGADAPGPPRT